VFTIALKHDRYSTYILSDEAALSRLEIVPERGGMVTRWTIQGQPILYLDEERFAHLELSVRGGIPILFPICGNLPDDLYSYHSQSYTLKQHGFARNLPWQVSEQKTEACASLTLVLTSHEQTRQVYPFDFTLTFTYQLRGNSLRILQRYRNNSPEKMPFSTGLHPYFWLQNKTQLSLDIPANEYQDQRTQQFSHFTGELDFDQDEIDIAFKSLFRHFTSFTDRQRRLQIALSFSDLFSTLVFWTIKGKNYICLEPWSAPRNALNTGEQLNYLEPGETCEAVVEIQVSHI
jgi:galactose mutarotase-like enzyme